MNVCTALETNAETTEVMQPCMRAFNDRAIFSKAAAMFGAALGDNRLDTAIAQRSSMPLRVATAIGVGHARSLQQVAAQSTNWRYRIDQRQHLRDIVNVCAGQDRRERRAIGADDDVVLGTGPRVIGGVWPSFWPPQEARIDKESTAAARNRFGLLRAALRAVARASDLTCRLLANRVAGADMSRPSRIPSRPADRASAVRS